MTQSSAEASAEPAHDDPTRLLLDAVTDYAIFRLDPEGYVVTWNAGAERIKGYKAAEIIGKHFSVFYPESMYARVSPSVWLRRGAGGASRTKAGASAKTARASSRRRNHPAAGSRRRGQGLREGHARHHRAQAGRRSVHQSEQRFSYWSASRGLRAPHGRPEWPDHDWNAGAERIKGYRAEEILGSTLPSSIRAKTSNAASPVSSSKSLSPTAATRRKAGACAKTAAASGPTSSSHRSATNTER